MTRRNCQRPFRRFQRSEFTTSVYAIAAARAFGPQVPMCQRVPSHDRRVAPESIASVAGGARVSQLPYGYDACCFDGDGVPSRRPRSPTRRSSVDCGASGGLRRQHGPDNGVERSKRILLPRRRRHLPRRRRRVHLPRRRRRVRLPRRRRRVHLPRRRLQRPAIARCNPTRRSFSATASSSCRSSGRRARAPAQTGARSPACFRKRRARSYVRRSPSRQEPRRRPVATPST